MSDGGTILRTVGSIASLVTGNPLFAIAANAAAAAFFQPEGPTVEGPRLNDLKVQSNNYGAPIPIVYGRARIAGNIIWVQNNRLIEVRVVEEADGGGKGGGGGGGEIVTYEYYATFAVSVCEGEVDGIRRIWADNVLIYDKSTGKSAASHLGQLQISEKITVYTGASDQEPNSLIEADVGTAPAYRGTCYVVFNRLPLEKYGNRIPNMTFEVVDGTLGGELVYEKGYTFQNTANMVEAVLSYPIDAAGRAVKFHPQYTSSYGNRWIDPIVIYVDGRERVGPAFEVNSSQREPLDKGASGVMSVSESDAPVLVMVNHTTLNRNADVFEWDLQSDIVTQRAWYQVPTGKKTTPHDMYNILDDEIIYFRNNGATDSTFYKARYPDGSVSTRYTLDVILNDTSFDNFPEAFTSDGTSLWVVLSTGSKVQEVDLATDTIVATYTVDRNYEDIKYDAFTGKLYLLNWLDASATKVYEWDPTTNTETLCFTFTSAPDKEDVEYWGIRGDIARTFSGTLGDNQQRMYAKDLISTADVTLSSIISDLCLRSGLSGSEIDVTGISDTVAGFVHTKVSPAKSDLETLARSFFFDAVESGYKIKFVSRGGASAVTLTDDDIAAYEHGQERGEPLIRIRERDVAIPNRVEVEFIDEARDFDPGSQYSERTVDNALGTEQIPLAVLMSAEEAAQIAEIQLWIRWLARHSMEFDLPVKYSYLEPTDVVTLNLDVGTFTARINEIDYGKPGIVRCKAVQELSEIYTAETTGQAGTAFTQSLEYLSATVFKLLDVPILRDEDDNAGLYMAGSPELGSGWDGAALFISNDSGETYSNFDAIINEATIGYTTDTLGDAEPWVFDRVNTVNVALYGENKTLSSVSETNLFAGSNMAAIGADGRWEIVKFLNATLENDGTYTLDTLIRGYRGTEWATGLHADADCFVLLTTNTIQRYSWGSSFLNLSRTYKAVTFGLTLIETSATTHTNTGVGLKPYAPVHIKGSRDGSDNLTITWTRRTRISGEWADLIDVPLGEDSENYEVDIIDAGSPDVVRTIAVTSESASYTAAQQTTDFGAAQSSVTVKVYQLSDTVGRGYVGEATV